MVYTCSIFGCSNRKDRESDLEYYRLPAIITNQGEECERLSSKRRQIWLANIGQDFQNKNLQNVRVCSAHFVNGKKSYLHDSLSPSWAPTLKLGRKRHVSETAGNRYDRMQDRKRRRSEKDEPLALEAFEEVHHGEGSLPDENGTSSQTDIDSDLMNAMQAELQQLRTENTAMKSRVTSLETKFSMDYFKDNDERVKHLTGLQTYTTLVILYQFLEPFLPTSLVMNKFKVMILTLVKLRLNLSNMFLAYEFETKQPTVSRLLTLTISAMYKRMQSLIKWPERETLQKTMPMEFRKNFGKKCAVIIDCFEVFIEKPTGLKARAETWS